jgi:hypothetical protein
MPTEVALAVAIVAPALLITAAVATALFSATDRSKTALKVLGILVRPFSVCISLFLLFLLHG